MNTIPAEAAAHYAAVLVGHPGAARRDLRPVADAARRGGRGAGGRVINGLQMLLHQAYAQVEQFTGLPAPKEAMRAALLGD